MSGKHTARSDIRVRVFVFVFPNALDEVTAGMPRDTAGWQDRQLTAGWRLFSPTDHAQAISVVPYFKGHPSQLQPVQGEKQARAAMVSMALG